MGQNGARERTEKKIERKSFFFFLQTQKKWRKTGEKDYANRLQEKSASIFGASGLFSPTFFYKKNLSFSFYPAHAGEKFFFSSIPLSFIKNSRDFCIFNLLITFPKLVDYLKKLLGAWTHGETSEQREKFFF